MYDMSSPTPHASDGSANGSETPSETSESAARFGLHVFQPHSLLSDVVEDIWDWDLPDAAAAKGLTMRLPPSAYIYLVLQYRVPLCADWAFGNEKHLHSLLRHVVVKMHAGIVTVRPVGPIGTVIVRIKPEAADRVMCAQVTDWPNRKVELCKIFTVEALARTEQAMARASDTAARMALVEEFLLGCMRPVQPASVLTQAAALLRFNPSMSVGDLASQLNISVRHLSRGFKATFGTGPKQFARLLRVEKAVAARRDGFGWTDIAHACGFADQAHLIHDFRAITGAAPEAIFRPPTFREVLRGESRRLPFFFNLFVC